MADGVLGPLLTLAGVVVAALIAALVTLHIHRDRRPKLRVSAGTSPQPEVRDGPFLSVTGSDTPPVGAVGEGHPIVDVRLTNNGTGTATIVGCEVEILWAHAFPTIRVPRVWHGRDGAMVLPESATYVAILPHPDKAAGKRIKGLTDRAVMAHDRHGRRPSHTIPAGESDRFIVRLEPEPHRWTGDMSTGMAQGEDGQLAYTVRMKISYDGDSKTRVVFTDQDTIISPANQIYLPTVDRIAKSIDKFLHEVRESESTANDILNDAGITPLTASEWETFHGASTEVINRRSHAELERIIYTLLERFSSAYFEPYKAISDYLDDCDLLYKEMLDDLPSDSEISRSIPSSFRTGRSQLADLRRRFHV